MCIIPLYIHYLLPEYPALPVVSTVSVQLGIGPAGYSGNSNLLHDDNVNIKTTTAVEM